MERDAAERFIRSLYQHVLSREPVEKELSLWAEKAAKGSSAEEIFRSFVTCREYVNLTARRVAEERAAPIYPFGHPHSPVVDPAEARKYVRTARGAQIDLPGIRISGKRMQDFWDGAIDFIRTTSFSAEGATDHRFYHPNPSYPYGDALILRAMIGRYRPARVIEVGSGFSSACMLDAAEDAGIEDFSLTCIDPYPGPVLSLLRPSDAKRVRIVNKPVQEVPVDLFLGLRRGDILFIDSTHVLKTGSDVCHELFAILPRLAVGVIAHFHDCQYPFEYPDGWIFDDNRSWNEIYAVRAFLMYNSHFEILFWNGFFARSRRARIAATFPAFLRQPGGGLWIERVGPPKASSLRDAYSA